MTNQEAIKYIENHGYISDDVKDMAIKALEKQIAIKPNKLVNVFGENEYMCKECENEIYRSIISNYCSSCGKKIDWSEK